MVLLGIYVWKFFGGSDHEVVQPTVILQRAVRDVRHEIEHDFVARFGEICVIGRNFDGLTLTFTLDHVDELALRALDVIDVMFRLFRLQNLLDCRSQSNLQSRYQFLTHVAPLSALE